MASRSALAGLLSRFALAGLANTACGFLVIALFDLGLGVGPHRANAAGYFVGLVLSFYLNRRFVFRADKPAVQAAPRFMIAAGCGFALNQAVLAAGLFLLGTGDMARLIAQGAGVATYSVTVFLLCRRWVFQDSAPGAAESTDTVRPA